MAKKQCKIGSRKDNVLLESLRKNKIFILSTEGLTEYDYFTILRNIISEIDGTKKIKLIKPNSDSSPEYVFERMEKELRKTKNRYTSYEAWLVIDEDNRSEDQLMPLYDWQKGNPKYGLAVSNPKFELWLLLHFEEGAKITHQNCISRLNKHLPSYSKNNKRIDTNTNKIAINNVNYAINRAKKMDNPPCTDWPRKNGTTVYKLAEKLL